MISILKRLNILLFCLSVTLVVACKGGGSTGGDTAGTAASTSPEETEDSLTVTADDIEFKAFDVTPSVTAGAEVTLNLEIATDDNSVVFYKISDHEEVKFKPNAGIIVPNKKKGTLITTLVTDQPGTYSFKVTLTNTQNKQLVKTFSTTITPP